MIENNVRSVRRARGITLAQLAGMLGLTQPSLTRIENGTQPISLDRVADIATALGCTPADILPPQWTGAFDADRFLRIFDAVNRALENLKLVSDERAKIQFVIFLYRRGCGAKKTRAANDNEILKEIRAVYNLVA